VDFTIPDKPYFTIGEVSRILELETYVIRYWESEFKSIKPIRTGADQRRYRKKDLEELLLIKKLLYEEGFTIAGARKKLLHIKKENSPLQTELNYRGSCDDIIDKLGDLKKGLQELKDLIS